ncbi:MAG: hypothetical protein MK165_05370 [Pirellulaceae bacterium]|nr:hypothetical protein [Pirellulaceae bacterium]
MQSFADFSVGIQITSPPAFESLNVIVSPRNRGDERSLQGSTFGTGFAVNQHFVV